MEQLLLCVLLLAVGDCALRPRRADLEWDYRSEAEKVSLRGCANLTAVLDNWRYAIMTQIRDLLLNDHHSVLPDYGRIKPLSEALDDLYKEFKALKERLGELTERIDSADATADQRSKTQRPPVVPEQPYIVPPLQLNPGILTNYGAQRQGMDAEVDQRSTGQQSQPQRPPVVPEQPYNVPPVQLNPGILTNYGAQRQRVKKGKP